MKRFLPFLFLLFLAVTTQAQRFLYSVNNFQELVALPVLPHTNIWVNWGYSQLDDKGGIFSYYSSSVTATNTTNCFKPLTRDGRYLKMLPQFFSGGGSAFDDPSAKVGPVMVPGSATTGIRSDGAPAIDLDADYPWNGQHTFRQRGIFFGPDTESWWGSELNDGTMAVAYSNVAAGDPNNRQIYSWIEDGTTTSEMQMRHTKTYSLMQVRLPSISERSQMIVDANGPALLLDVNNVTRTWFRPKMVDAADAVVYDFDTANFLDDAGALLARFRNFGTNKLTIAHNGDLSMIKMVPYSWPASQGAASTVLLNDGSGNLSWSSSVVPPSFAAPTTLVTDTASEGTSTNALRADAGLALDTARNWQWTGQHTIRRNANVYGLVLQNTNNATSGAPNQETPWLSLDGKFWDGSASRQVYSQISMERFFLGNNIAAINFYIDNLAHPGDSFNVLKLTEQGDVVTYDGTVGIPAATTNTHRFFFIPTITGTPTGTPGLTVGNSGYGTPIVADESGSGSIWFYDASAAAWQRLGPLINPTDGYVPYRVSASSFGDSPWRVLDANRVSLVTLTNILTVNGSFLTYTNGDAQFGFELRKSDGTVGKLQMTTGSHLNLLAGAGSDLYFGVNNNGSGDMLLTTTALSPLNNHTVSLGSAATTRRWKNLDTSGGRSIGRVETATAYTLSSTNHYLAATATCTVNLPQALSTPAGQLFIVKDVNNNTITVARNGSDTIDGAAANDSLTARACRWYVCDGVSNWEVVADF